MEMTNQVYGQMVNEFSKESPKVKDSVLAFAVGGGICVIGQILKNVYTAWGVSEQDAGIWVTITLIFLSALFTGLKLYDKLAKSEGYITGMAAKMFQIAGPVLVFGIGSSVIYGMILVLFRLV